MNLGQLHSYLKSIVSQAFVDLGECHGFEAVPFLQGVHVFTRALCCHSLVIVDHYDHSLPTLAPKDRAPEPESLRKDLSKPLSLPWAFGTGSRELMSLIASSSLNYERKSISEAQVFNCPTQHPKTAKCEL